ncbi:MAG: release factor glutamine methyltransferase [Lysobacteraceae bacterium]|nr:MAG: release factor glutamine methyltransferase [Xanthomonadaceae bacterium]
MVANSRDRKNKLCHGTVAWALQQHVDARWILATVTGHNQAWFVTHYDAQLQPQWLTQFEAMLCRRLSGEPLDYILGTTAFRNFDLDVDDSVLTPRADTEVVIDLALSHLASDRPTRCVDLGTGSGAIAIAIALERPLATVVAVDRSNAALATARNNMTKLGVSVETHLGHWLQGLDQRFDLIVSNPPYIAEDDPHLAELQHEPLSALVSGPDGLDDLRAIIKQAPAHLLANGWLLLEHGHDQKTRVIELMHEQGFVDVAGYQDLGGNDRAVEGRWPGP